MDAVLDKAKSILAEKERTNICIKANICPICGENLINTQEKVESSYDDGIFWKATHKFTYTNYFLGCSKDSSHVKIQETSDYDYNYDAYGH